MSMSKIHRILSLASKVLGLPFLFTLSSFAEPLREWDWHLPGDVYKELEFTDRAAVDRAVKLFQQAIDAERRGEKVTDLVPMYRAARAEWKKVQIQAEAEGFDEQLLSYVIFMQGLCAARAHDRNEAIKMFGEVIDLYPDETWVSYPARYYLGVTKVGMGDVRAGDDGGDPCIHFGKIVFALFLSACGVDPVAFIDDVITGGDQGDRLRFGDGRRRLRRDGS
mgnify:CR=1 FL=1